MMLKKRIAGMAWLGASMLFGAGLFAAPARAGYIVTLTQVGRNVVATGSGKINLAGLSFEAPSGGNAAVSPVTAFILTGPTSPTRFDLYTGVAGPTSFGSGSGAIASSGRGDAVGMSGFTGELAVPQGYVSGSLLSDSATYDGATFASLGATPGTYVWTWGSGPTFDTFKLEIKTTSVPEPSSLLVFALPAGLVVLLAARRRRPVRNAGSG